MQRPDVPEGGKAFSHSRRSLVSNAVVAAMPPDKIQQTHLHSWRSVMRCYAAYVVEIAPDGVRGAAV